MLNAVETSARGYQYQYQYQCPASQPGYDYEIISCGPGGIPGGDDDLSNIELL